MKRKHLLYGMLTIILLATATVMLILQAADLPNKKNNGFKRNVITALSNPIAEKKLGGYVSKISGITSKCIYVSGYDPSWVLRLDYSLNVIDTLWYIVTKTESLRDPSIFIDSPHIFMYAPGISYLLKGEVDSMRIDTVKLQTELITRVAQISSDKLVVRAIDSTQTRQVFRIINCINGQKIKEVDLIPQQQFGGFETDGLLKYDKSTNKIFYTLMFQNKFLCLDTNLNLIYTAHTIDTTYTNTVNIGLINENGITKVMSTKPRVITNKGIDIYQKYIYILSGLRADNEKLSAFNKSFPLDIYDIDNGNYIASYHIPKINGKKVKDFKITDKLIIVLYDEGTCAIYEFKHP